MQVFRKHVFVCTNQRPSRHRRGDCASVGGEEVHRSLKDLVVKAGLQPEIRINKAGCLDQCAQGPVMVVYPEGVWYVNVQPEDVEEIFQSHLLDDTVVERLVMEKSDRDG